LPAVGKLLLLWRLLLRRLLLWLRWLLLLLVAAITSISIGLHARILHIGCTIVSIMTLLISIVAVDITLACILLGLTERFFRLE
jgi:hypothetical protein